MKHEIRAQFHVISETSALTLAMNELYLPAGPPLFKTRLRPVPFRRTAAAGQRDRPRGGLKNYKVKTPFLNVWPAVVNRYYIYGLPRQKAYRFLAFDSKTVGEKKEEKRRR